ncbi:uncharacterized protein LOC142546522 isoform X2 [Primulina tabacum]|uniref:uncharacterized protein LOC142546522 isoform X2 n=1 Tax=Primulina tabacum TaxID=48773 RepID=UPI003F5AB635
MELCTARGISNLLFHKPKPPPPHIAPSNIRYPIKCSTPCPAHLKQTRSTSGPRYTIISCLSSTTEATTYEAVSPDETTTVTTSPEDTMFVADAPEEITPEETVPEISVTEATSGIKDEPESEGAMTVEVVDSLPFEKKEDYINQPDVVLQEDDSLQLLKFLEDLNIKFDYENKYSIVALGIGGLISLRIAVAVIGAIDSIPLFPKVLELVGLGYTIWFTTRYLIFEQKRGEFVARVKQFKEEVIGQEND